MVSGVDTRMSPVGFQVLNRGGGHVFAGEESNLGPPHDKRPHLTIRHQLKLLGCVVRCAMSPAALRSPT